MGSHFFTTGKDGVLKLWDTAMRKVVSTVDLGGGPLNDALVLTGDKILLASGSHLHLAGINCEDADEENSHIQILETHQNVTTHSSRIKCLHLDRRTYSLYVGCGDGVVQAWKVAGYLSYNEAAAGGLPVTSPMTIANSMKF